MEREKEIRGSNDFSRTNHIPLAMRTGIKKYDVIWHLLFQNIRTSTATGSLSISSLSVYYSS